MIRWSWIWLGAVLCALPAGTGAAQDSLPQRLHAAAWRRGTVHYGKWLTAGAAVALTALAAKEHRASRREWDQLLEICRSADDACTLAPDGRYLLYDAEVLYQHALYYDRRASHRLLGGQAGLLLTAALFILDRRRGEGDGPDNIPFAPLRVTANPADGRVQVGMRIAF